MKRITVLSVALIFALAVFSTAAMAASFNVTANYGVRVAEKGVCEQVGSVTIAGAADADTFTAGSVITVELLAQAKICKDVEGVGYDYASHMAGGADYTVDAVTGDDFFTITINSTSAAGDTIRVGHDADSSICMNLSDTPYNSTDPNLQLVQVSYRDDVDSTYTGDTFVATVKPQLHDIAVCTKTQGDDLISYWSDDLGKSGLIQIPLCFESSESQDQVVTDCGMEYADQQVCIQLKDAGNQFTASAYNFTLTTAKAGVGISAVNVVDASGLSPLTRRDINGDVIVPSSDPLADAVATKSVDFEATLAGAGTQYVVVTLAYDTCTASAGELLADVSFSKDPCGDSFAVTDLAIAEMVTCGGGPSDGYALVFPYATDFVNGGWWVGLALTNVTANPITVALDIYEADGDHYTATVDVPAHGITTQLAGDLNATTTGADAQFGDERFWMTATSNTGFTGFLMQGDGTQANGYLPEPAWKMFGYSFMN